MGAHASINGDPVRGLAGNYVLRHILCTRVSTVDSVWLALLVLHGRARRDADVSCNRRPVWLAKGVSRQTAPARYCGRRYIIRSGPKKEPGCESRSFSQRLALYYSVYTLGFDGPAYIIGWTEGFCLVALFIAPFLRKLGHFTIPDFLAARYGDAGTNSPPRLAPSPNGATTPETPYARPGICLRRDLVRILAAIATVLVSFTYVVAQIYGVGLISSRFTGVDFSVGIFLGLASILVCSFLGGMRAVTWTQVVQSSF